ncbi:Zinc-type alcohol dehydrogenase-like protein [Flavobacterium bizetiae]|uniref:Zinc-type alcohol dehydrogenase-like protein n=1 Tax=Flavobacterium bizetiae TaxID=2704140 RepID=A0A6J4GUF0_9FLAO|nr:zinc-dependent alcohol dehydrogenase family protein [Flavobacterium bizetiae]CAA9202925.1 Zinc-type alcohol dehydrogenase-like protein [Flavobacterium bizetiae]CAD5343002.1 Zinc-type alcohol dehydrogenase-like protein [Flavobacterium bizetiae]CAD5350467.1 Zinc-type alcohol dehydrogenase-like protein [Flavobacterium bizetiae]
MKALVLKAFNTPYELQELNKPIAGKGQVLVKIKASAINPLDLKIKSGQAGHAQIQLPAILGVDLAGIVQTVGEGVTQFKPGDEVYGMTGGVSDLPGSLSEYAAVDADLLAFKPVNLSFKEAASLPLAFITAWEGLADRANISPDKTVLIHGGAGGVGHIAVQIAVAKGAKVYSTVDPDKNQIIEQYGAVPIDYKNLSAEAYVDLYTDGDGFDIILDTVGGSVLDDSFKASKRYTGHVLSMLGWGTHSLAPLSFRGATYSGIFTLYPLLSGKNRAHHGAVLQEATKLAEAGKLKPLVDSHHYTLNTVTNAYEAMEQRTNTGKVVISI